MQAIVKEQRAPGLTVTTVPKPSAGPGEVLIRVRHAGVCGTDLHIADWDAWAQGRIKPPVVVGHEFAGEIVTLGEGVTELKVGQLVTAEGHIVGELGAVLLGAVPGRLQPEDVTLFKSVGVAVEDVATAAEVYRRASEQGLGQEMRLQPR